MNTIFKFRIDDDLKKEFQKKCVDIDMVPSEVLRDYVHTFTYDNVDTVNNGHDTSVDLVKKHTTKSGRTHYYTSKPVKIIEIASGEVKDTYEEGKTLKFKYMNKDKYIIKEA